MFLAGVVGSLIIAIHTGPTQKAASSQAPEDRHVSAQAPDQPAPPARAKTKEAPSSKRKGKAKPPLEKAPVVTPEKKDPVQQNAVLLNKSLPATDAPTWDAACLPLFAAYPARKARIEAETDALFLRMLDNGLVDKAKIVTSTLQHVPGPPIHASDALVLVGYESSGGADQGKPEGTDALGIMQITPKSFLTMFGRFLTGKGGQAYQKVLDTYDTGTACRVRDFASFVSFDSKESRVDLHEDLWRAAQDKRGDKGQERSLRASLLSLREGDSGHFLSMLLAFADLKKLLPSLITQLNAYPHLRTLQKWMGDAFLIRGLHNWGYGNLRALLEADPSRRIGRIIDEKTLLQNGHTPDEYVGTMLVALALDYHIRGERTKELLEKPRLVRMLQEKRAQKIAKRKAAKAASGQQVQSATPKPGQKLSALSPVPYRKGLPGRPTPRRGSEKGAVYQA